MIDDWFEGPELEAARSLRSTISYTQQHLNVLNRSFTDRGLILLVFRNIRKRMFQTIYKLNDVLKYYDGEVNNNEQRKTL